MTRIVADSSFYICFLSNIKRPDYLVNVIKRLNLFIGRVVKTEIEGSDNFNSIKGLIGNKLSFFEYDKYRELLRPFFSASEIKRGETEVIAISVIFHNLGFEVLIVMDDIQPRNYISRNFTELKSSLKWTIEFVKYLCEVRIFSKEDTIKVLKMIEVSDFRAPKIAIEKCIKEVSKLI